MSDSLQDGVVVALPMKMSSRDRDILVVAGAEFGDRLEDEPELVNVRLPPGWEHDSDSSPYFTFLLDEKGRQRAQLFSSHGYASIQLLTRYEILFDRESLDSTGRVIARVVDGARPVFTTQPRAVEKPYNHEFYRAQTDVVNEAKAWLDANRPGWTKPSAYWD